MTVYPDSTIVDEDDNVIGHMQMPEAYRQGKILRVSRVVITNSKKQVLLQLRGPKVMGAGKWQEAASGHVDHGDSYETTAHKELEEEMGITGLDLQEISYYLEEEDSIIGTVKRFQKLFQGMYDGEVTTNDEVADFKWVDLDILKSHVQESPHDYTPAMERILELIVPTD